MCTTCGYDKVLNTIVELIDDGDFDYALDTLNGIAENIEQKEHVTVGQFTAVENIKARPSARRYRG